MLPYPRTTHYIAAFLRRMWAPCRGWEKPSLMAWVQWHINHDRCLTVSQNGRLVTASLFRRVHNQAQAAETYTDTNGPIVYIELAASRLPGGMKACFNLLRIRETGLSHMAWVRGKHGDRPTLVPMATAARHLVYGRH